jgi:hypothetical protein
MNQRATPKVRARQGELHSFTESPGIRIKAGFHKPTPMVQVLGSHLFQAVGCKATWMLQRRLRGSRFAKMSPADRKAHVQKIATEIANKIEARLIAFGPCYHPRQVQPLRLWDSLKRHAADREFLATFGRTIQSPPNPILNKTEIVTVYLWACCFRFENGEVVHFRSLSDERQREILSGVLGRAISLDGYRKARRRIGKAKARRCVSLSDARTWQIISGVLSKEISPQACSGSASVN